jgi:prepilin-type N-terminal cleavage/methylation domain-containing protein
MDIGHKLHTTSSRQQGFSLMEIMISLTLSLVVTAAMVALMSSSLGNTSRIVNMTKLTDAMRMTMQMLTRDVRRTSYNADAMYCYANEDCGTDGSLTVAPDIIISASGDCFTYLLDRDHDGDSTENDAGGFRRVTAGGVGVIEMWIGDASPDCTAADSNWVNITNPDSMDISTFSVDDDLSYSDVIFDDGAGTTISQRVRKLRIVMGAQLTADGSISRDIEDIISVRNDILL